MNKKTTALTVLIEKIDSDISSALSTMPLNTPFIEYLREHRENAISLLQKERENMDVSFVAGAKAYYNRDFNITEAMHDAKGYFNRLFTQYKPQ